MERFIYAVYNFLLTLMSPVIVLALAFRYPKTFFQDLKISFSMRMGFYLRKGIKWDRPVWIHGASLGESKAAYPLITAIKKENPGTKIIFSTMTSNGFQEAKRFHAADHVIYAPIDLPFIVKKTLAAIRPKLIIILESDFWPNLLKTAKSLKIPAGVVNGRISEKSFKRYSMVRKLTNIMLSKIDFICAREAEDEKRFKSLGVPKEKITVTGNLKFDALPLELNEKSMNFKNLFSLGGRDLIWTAGSIREGEEILIFDAFQKLRTKFPSLKLIAAPRHLDNLSPLLQIMNQAKLPYTLKSKWPGNSNVSWDVLIWDTFGDLWQAYLACRVAFVGGSLVDKGGQNPIEPAWFSKPVFFGPHMENFIEPAEILLKAKGAFQVRDESELAREIENLLNDPAKLNAMGACARKSIEVLAGLATKETLKILTPYLKGR